MKWFGWQLVGALALCLSAGAYAQSSDAGQGGDGDQPASEAQPTGEVKEQSTQGEESSAPSDTESEASGTKRAHRVEAPAETAEETFTRPETITRINREDIERRNPEDLGDVVHDTPGVTTQHTSAGQASPFVRGMTGKQLLFLVDGFRFNNSAFRGGPNQYFSTIDPYWAQEIEIVRGPHSVLYGSDALGGSINVISREPMTDADYLFSPGAYAMYSSANRGLKVVGDLPFNLSGQGTPLAGYISINMGNYENLVGGHKIGEMPATSYREYGGNMGLRYNLDPHWNLDFRFAHQTMRDVNRTDSSTIVVADPTLLPDDGMGNPIPKDRLRRFPVQADTFSTLRLSYDDPIGVMREFNIGVLYHLVDEQLHRTTNGSPDIRRESDFEVTTLGLVSQAVFDFGDASRLTVGMDAYYDTIRAARTDHNTTTGQRTENNDSAQFADDSTYLLTGIYAQDEIFFAKGQFVLRPGVRFTYAQADSNVSQFGGGLDDVNQDFFDVTPSLALSWQPVDWFNTTLSASRGFRAPNLDDLASAKGTGRGEEIPNPNLDPEELWAFQLNAKVLLPNKDPHSAAPYRLRAEGAYFEHLMTDVISSINTTFQGEDVVQLQNRGRARLFGWEAAAQYYFGDELTKLGASESYILYPGDALGVWAHGSYIHGDNQTVNEPISRMPPLNVNLGMVYEFDRGGFYIEPSMEMWDKQDRYAASAASDVRFQKPHTSGYTLYNLSAGWRPNDHLHFRLSIRNITNKNYQVQGSGPLGTGTDVRLSCEVRW